MDVKKASRMLGEINGYTIEYLLGVKKASCMLERM